MEYLVMTREMREYDRITIDVFGIPSMVLMERAASAVAAVIVEQFKEAGRILAVCGTGNNGGDGMAAGRILKQQGYEVTFVIVGREENCTEETRRQLEIIRNYGYPITDRIPEGEYDIVVDAMFGIGCSRELMGGYRQIVEQINEMPAKVVAVDIPSGIHTDTGEILGVCVEADITVTFAFKKRGHLLYPGTAFCGTVICRDIGVTEDSFRQESQRPEMITYGRADLKRLPPRRQDGNKGTFGKILVIAGSKNMSGACELAALAAYRMGSGLVRIFTVEENRDILQQVLPEAVLVTYTEENWQRELQDSLQWSSAVVIGPGMGHSKTAAKIAETVLQEKMPVVWDADAITILANDKTLQVLMKEKQGGLIITPHIGELARVMSRTVEEIQADRVKWIRKLAEDLSITVVSKDARTLVYQPGERIYLNQSGNEGMATAGSGDVLTGILVGLLAQGMTAYEAACLGVYIHGLAGDLASEKTNAYYMLSRDLIEQLQYILRNCK